MIDWSLNPRVNYAANMMRQGGVIAYPTEAVWGLGCNPFDEDAVADLLALKQRPVEKGVILIAANLQQIEPFIDHLDDLQRQRLKNTWPGPVTWLVPNNGLAPHWITGAFPSVALRVTDHPVAAGLCRAFGGPVVSTSCNPAGKPPARNIHEVRRYFGGQLDAVSSGLAGRRTNPSEIRDLLTGQVVRPS
ncbi:L-threonylcarbamoyladenylate synthase [Cellvibrio japonicus]|uniref:Threonylcarbamoyl-AMP synthase n=1 Tax=Cellvibrio japonicus (strain Ueda107) TaxID=498211 RepID=TSAC_CELJU|nr:Sua5/YciO/YrdC/YwlC family protein [Cellvibrio japonicus]B3PGZ1.2 RecName: Full=Threonylcarbamoyl-AMP synthase; Short=TC-AMP synthase; AltName: Full=L-threonylcarbamoyladenylate synthase; AltName: Full=t(6)A37 threonylcarbamoyladenosine biosynthesis protein TsaC; AltName: Full=tRNA threonylcarbamoyladenosine biosynthesis protein TsaC [Cellvibrio japonicus Ueda107]QEI13793.1 tRNA threonylcarbamoyladenosine biosynthesis protein RimN [Cellvibrio japonicus]QEI17367.1 tRNA threonylcarbamoyladenosi